jgi:chromosome segregation protein
MKIKKLELSGFKSFVDRTVIHFDHDVLGIVGPNGCGKSNIVDAIRWCMGEQSAKHLRGKSMEDVIFNGSESRAGAELAEVTLTFENDDATDLPLEYRDYAEIAVTRRLHRSGESEYLINKTPVRLKDITDLFLGTGVGTKAYSIVEQGKIGLIVSAKPEDRRMLIEEAAGITKYKSKKKQAERKMELTQQNLLRVGDIVAEIERNLGSLKRQAAKAERYLSYRAELEDLQLLDASHKYLELVGWTKMWAEQVVLRTQRADETRSTLAAREAELETARIEALSAEEELEKATNAAFAAENEVRAEEAAIARAKDRLEGIRAREQQAVGEGHEIAEQHAHLAAERETYAKEIATLEADEGGRAERTATEEARLAERIAEQNAADGRVAELRQQLARADASIASAEAKLAGFERQREDMQIRLERLRLEQEDRRQDEREHTARQRTLAREAEELRAGKVTTAAELAELEARLKELKARVPESEKALEAARDELARKRSRLHALLDMHAKLEGVGAGTKALCATKDPAIVGLVADRVEAPAELTAALAGLLGTRLQDVIVRGAEDGVRLLAALAAGKKGRATTVPLRPRYVAGPRGAIPDGDGVVGRLFDALRFAPEDEALVRSLVGDALVVRDEATALAVRADAGSAPIVTLSGTVLFADGRVAGGTGEEIAAAILDQKREARELGEAVAALDARASELLAAHNALRTAVVEAQAALDQARQAAHQGELALMGCEKDLRATESALAQTRARLEQIAKDLAELESKLAASETERVAAEAALSAARAEKDEAHRAIAEAEAGASAARAAVDAQRAVVTEHKVLLASAREKLGAARGTIYRLDRSLEELAARRTRLEEELAESARAFGETAAQLVAHKERLHAALDAHRDAQGLLSDARAVYEDLRRTLGEREAGLKELRAEAEAAREALTEADMGLREKQIALEHLLGGVAEKFRGLHLPRVVGDYHLRPPPNEDGRSRMAELATLIDRMGSVNLDAMREHEEAEKRYAFYTTQKADLEKALADLERAIQQMNRESKRLFQETYEAVNARFQEIFPRMFRGGRASLRLTNPEDMLETGIDILAQPPGKKLSTIELMSGGEKALTAVSLIFAIFQIKPSPFCILDEVDAPLDEANVARYNEMIRSMTDRSQFILITHIKRTMQMVDVLYGVTMGEPGVSRLVSVKMQGKAEQAAPKKDAEAGPEAQVA